MQVGNEKNITERAMYYLSKLYSGQISQSEDYQKMKKTIVIAILNFSYYNRAEYHSVAHMKFEINKNEEERLENFEGAEQEIVTDKLEYHVIDLKRFKQKSGTGKELADWLNLILGDKEKIKMGEKKNKEIEKAVKVVEEMGQDPETRELYRLIQKGRIEENTRISNALEEGREEGKKKSKIEIAKKLLKKGETKEEVVEITGLTIEEIEKIDIK